MKNVPVLSILAPGLAPHLFRLERTIVRLGRDPECELTFEYPWLSRLHLVFEREAGIWSVRREGRNEVLVNGRALEGTRPLEPGDSLELGPMTIVFEARGARAVELDDREVGAVTMELPVAELLAARGAAGAGARSRLGHLALLGRASAELAGASEPAKAAARAAELLLEAIGARSTCVVESPRAPIAEAPGSRSPDRLLGSAGAPVVRVSRLLVERALADGATLSVDDASSAGALAGRASIAGSLVGPVLVAPLGSPMRGVLYADRVSGDRPFDRDDATFATVLAHLLGPSLIAARQKAAVLEANERIGDERRALQSDLARRGGFGALVGTSPPMERLAGQLAKVAPTNATVLITGETGSGKELVAREVHQRSQRARSPFFALNCAALPESLIESELFGHKKGAFSGADADRRGLFEVASGGTVFLDEVGELSLAAQAKILRVLEARELLPLGGGAPVQVDVRLIAATHRDLAAMSAVGKFRLDLYYRLNIFPLSIPPLRERREDIPALVAYFLERSTEARRKALRGPDAEALEALGLYEWPGNVRELSHAIERAAILADEGEELGLGHLPEELALTAAAAQVGRAREVPEVDLASTQPDVEAVVPVSLHEAVAELERALIIRELDRDGWNRTRTAKRLKISRRAFMDKLRRYGIKEGSG